MDSCVNRNHAKDERMNEQVILSFTSPQMCECQSVQTKHTSLFHTSKNSSYTKGTQLRSYAELPDAD